MIQSFVNSIINNKDTIKTRIKDNPPQSYMDIITLVVNAINIDHSEDYYNTPDSTRITEIDHGHYQGTLVYIIGGSGYQPSTYWVTKVSYGSCSGCDTLEAIRDNESTYDYDTEVRTYSDQAIEDYYTLCLHVVQNIKEI